jgi:hypothetical protein
LLPVSSVPNADMAETQGAIFATHLEARQKIDAVLTRSSARRSAANRGRR